MCGRRRLSGSVPCLQQGFPTRSRGSHIALACVRISLLLGGAIIYQRPSAARAPPKCCHAEHNCPLRGPRQRLSIASWTKELLPLSTSNFQYQTCLMQAGKQAVPGAPRNDMMCHWRVSHAARVHRSTAKARQCTEKRCRPIHT